MNDLYFAIVMLIVIGGLYYFWFKCQIFAVNKSVLLMGLLITPVAVVVGVYWAIKDLILFRNLSSDTEVNPKSEPKNSVPSKKMSIFDELYLKALDEYESGSKDRALYARLYAENDGDEALVKAKYIKHRAEQMS